MIDGRIFKLKKILFEKPDHNWTIEEMAKIVDLSPSHLQKLFKINMGVSPMACLLELRLEKARELLENPSLQIKQISRMVGIPNDSHFTRDFKKNCGLTPTEFRRFHQEKVQAEALNDRIGQEMIGSAKK